jgi:hypothetical protein
MLAYVHMAFCSYQVDLKKLGTQEEYQNYQLILVFRQGNFADDTT